jgi:pimeloyl-ACP methyl ester carboxylesterase
MPHAQSHNARIHYQVVGDGPPMVLYHAFCGSLQDWHEFGYVEQLAPRFRLLLLDARGHGDSDKPGDPAAYALDIMADDVLAVLNAEGMDSAHYWGYSMGGRVGFALAHQAPERLRSLIIGGIHPYPQNPEGIQRRIATWRRGLATIEGHMAAGFGPSWSDEQRTRFMANDLQAMIAYLQALYVSACGEAPEASILHNIPAPALYYVGTKDAIFYPQARRFAGQHPAIHWRPLEGLDHYAAYYRADVVAPIGLAFLQNIVGAEEHRPAPNGRL